MAKLEIFEGQKKELIMPSLHKVTIREQSAQDDEILGRMSKGDMIDALNDFVSTIVVGSNYPFATGPLGTMDTKEVLSIPTRDKHYILLASRIHSMGSNLYFNHKCDGEDCGIKSEYEEDLSAFDRDLSILPGSEAYENKSENAVVHYEHITEAKDVLEPIEFTLSSGKQVRMNRMTGHSELGMLEANKNNALTSNTELFVRNISLFHDGQWVKLSSMNVFSKRESIEIKAEVQKFDQQFTPFSEFTCPKCGQKNQVPLVIIPDFFFPTKI